MDLWYSLSLPVCIYSQTIMDPGNYKKIITSRNITYNYYVTSPGALIDATKPIILFLHGFPSIAADWDKQVIFFEQHGYCVIVPDMLGYGGTDKPMDVQSYQMKLLAKDVIDVLDAENIDRVVVIGHDWGSAITSRLACLYPERFLAFGFLAMSYTPPSPDFNYVAANLALQEVLGYSPLGYWEFFSHEDAPKIIEDNWDGFKSLAFPEDPVLWRTNLTPFGAARDYISKNKVQPRPSCVSQEFEERFDKTFRHGAVAAPLNYYKAMTQGVTPAGDREIPQARYTITKPVFFGATLQDYACSALAGKADVAQFCIGPVVIKEYNSWHWIMLSHSEQLNQDLLTWIEGL